MWMLALSIGITAVCIVLLIWLLFIPISIGSRSDSNKKNSVAPATSKPHRLMRTCKACQREVPLEAIHCESCVECSETLDHHSSLVERCIVKANKTCFVVFLLSCFAHVLFHVIVWSVALHRVLSETSASRSTAEKAFIVVSLVIDSLYGFWLCFKLGFTLYLHILKQSAYEFYQRKKISTEVEQVIIKKNQEEQEALKPKGVLKSKKGKFEMFVPNDGLSAMPVSGESESKQFVKEAGDPLRSQQSIEMIARGPSVHSRLESRNSVSINHSLELEDGSPPIERSSGLNRSRTTLT